MKRPHHPQTRWLSAAILAVALTAGGSTPHPEDEVGIPFIQRFTPREYRGHSQSLGFAFDADGLLTVANLITVLQYDGSGWRHFDVPGTSTVYSIAITDDRRIYVGGSGVLGYFEPTATGGKNFVSLGDKIPADLKSPDEAYRKVVATRDGVFFQCFRSVLRWHDGRFDALELPGERSPLIFALDGELYVAQLDQGLFVLKGEKLEPVCNDEFLKRETIRAIEELPDGSLLLGILRGGVFRCVDGKVGPFAEPAIQAKLADRLVGDVVRLKSGEIAVATYRGGIAFLDDKGNGLRWLDDHSGLPTPLVAGLLQDVEGGLWCLLENGIARIEVHSPVTVFDARAGVNSSAAAFARHDDSLYLGTLRGVLRLIPADGPGNPAHWEPVANATGQAFTVLDHPDGLLASVDNSIVRIRGGVAEVMLKMPSLTYALTRSVRDPDVVFASSRYGLAALRLVGGRWTNEGFMPGMEHEIRDLHEDPDSGTIWFGTVAHGAGRIDGAGRPGAKWWETATLKEYGVSDGLPADGFALLERVGGRNLFTTGLGMMVFNPSTDRFDLVPRAEIGPVVDPDAHWATLACDDEGNMWGTVEPNGEAQDTSGTRIEYRTADGRGFVVPANVFDAAGNIQLLHIEEEGGHKVIWVGGTEAVLRWDAARSPTGVTPSGTTVLLRRASIGGNALPLDGTGASEVSMHFDSESGPLRFEYASPSFDRDAKPEFSTRLVGFDRDWGPWGAKPDREFSYLPSGGYRFQVRARTAAGGVAQAAIFGFQVPPPWYLTVPAYGGYAILGLFGVAGIVRWRGAALRRRNEQLEATITERTSELKSARDDADRANRAKSVFLANMSHELRTPLNGILGYTQILRRDPAMSAQNRQRLGVLESSGEHLLRLINEVLDLSKIEAGRLELHPVATDVGALAQAVAATLKPRLDEKGLGFFVALDPSLPACVLLDEQKVGQVLFNLLGNAVKFTKEGRVELRLTTTSNDHAQPQLRFEVADTGIGIPPEQQSRIFEPFSQVDDGTRRGEGTGLGLAICARIVGLMDGRLNVESEPGRGSRFWFEIPVNEIEGPAPSGATRSDEPEITGYEGPRRRVLVVDDVPVNRSVICELLAPLGFEVAEAADGASAIEALRARMPDIVLMDLRMAPMSGVDAVKRIRADGSLRGLRIVAFSASTIGFTRAQALEIGCDDLLSKPFRESDLFAVLERQIQVRWRHAAATGTAAPGTATAPSAGQAVAILSAARRGDAAAVRDELRRLAVEDPALEDWTGEMERLVAQFRMQEIRRRLEALAHVS